MSSKDRIVVDPEHLDRVAITMRGAASLYSRTGQQLAAEPLDALSPAARMAVEETLQRAGRTLQALAAELMEDAAHLHARATWVLMGNDEDPWRLTPDLGGAGYELFAGEPSSGGGRVETLLIDATYGSVETVDTHFDQSGPRTIEHPVAPELMHFATEVALDATSHGSGLMLQSPESPIPGVDVAAEGALAGSSNMFPVDPILLAAGQAVARDSGPSDG